MKGYCVTFRVFDNPRYKKINSRYYLIKCDDKDEAELVVSKLKRMNNVSYINLNEGKCRYNVLNRTIINAKDWLATLNK